MVRWVCLIAAALTMATGVVGALNCNPGAFIGGCVWAVLMLFQAEEA